MSWEKRKVREKKRDKKKGEKRHVVLGEQPSAARYTFRLFRVCGVPSGCGRSFYYLFLVLSRDVASVQQGCCFRSTACEHCMNPNADLPLQVNNK